LPGAEMPGAIEGAGGTMAADTTGLPGAGPPGVVGGAGVTLVAKYHGVACGRAGRGRRRQCGFGTTHRVTRCWGAGCR
jgi:hypothetical protein